MSIRTLRSEFVIALVVLGSVSVTSSAEDMSQSCQYATHEGHRVATMRDRGIPLWKAKEDAANADEARDITWIYKHPELSPMDLEDILINQCDKSLYRIAPVQARGN
jgi:hypothetical protein